jgi:very-short-patch-repair endonuclease
MASHFNRTTFKTAIARRLRRASTNVEMRLWQKLRNRQLGMDFRRQHPAGPFVLDFYSPSLRLAIELDGGQHAEARKEDTDRERDQWLADHGVTVMRFWNSDAARLLETWRCSRSDRR